MRLSRWTAQLCDAASALQHLLLRRFTLNCKASRAETNAEVHPMTHWLKHLDRILRGEATRPAALRGGRLELPALGLAIIAILLGMFYGLCMGSFALISGRAWGWQQMLASMV